MKNFSLSGKQCIGAGLLILAVFAVYLPSGHNEFVWDDYYLIVNNPLIRDLGAIPSFFSQDLGNGSGQTYNFYRPLQVTAYDILYRFFGTIPQAYRLMNILAHALTTAVFYFLLIRLFGWSWPCFCAALLFAVHPVNSETIFYISCFSDCLAVLFMMTAFILYLKLLDQMPDKGSPMLLAAFLLSSCAAMLSKELGMVLPALIAFYHWLFRRKMRWGLFVPVCLILAEYLLIRQLSLATAIDPKGFSVPLLQKRIPGFFVAVLEYTRLFFLPAGLHMDYGIHYFRWFDPRVLAGAALCAWVLWYFQSRKREAMPAFGLGVYAIGLIAHSNLLIYLNQAYMMEHWFYLSSMGLSCAVAYWIKRFLPSRISAVLCCCFVVSLAAVTVRQSAFWKNEEAVYQRSLAFSPRNFRALANLCSYYWHQRECDKAIEACNRALEIVPDSTVALSNLAVVYFTQGEKEKAVHILERLVEQGRATDTMKRNLEYMRRHREAGVQ